MSSKRTINETRAKALLKDVSKVQKRYHKKLSVEQKNALQQTKDRLEAALQSKQELLAPYSELEQTAASIFAPWQKSQTREYIESILIAVLIALTLRTFFIEPFKIPSGSMIPTLSIGDHIFVNKLSYGLWLPFFQKKMAYGGGPQRGDVIVFVYPVNPAKDFIKRVVGLPGDSIEVKHGRLFINGKETSRVKGSLHSYLEPEDEPPVWVKKQGQMFEETLGDAKFKILMDNPIGSGIYSNWTSKENGPLTRRAWGPKVPPNHVFVMGDNRDHSSDSREWGLVPMESIKGKAILIWLSYNQAEGFQADRIFKPIK